MTKEDKGLLLKQAAKLYTLGITVERERKKLKKLVERGVPIDSPEILTTLERCEKLSAEWNQLESEHLELRKRLDIKQ